MVNNFGGGMCGRKTGRVGYSATVRKLDFNKFEEDMLFP
jgi:hypothetical protein